MKTTLLALSLFSLSALAQAAAPQDSPEAQALRTECAQKYSAGYASQDAAKAAAPEAAGSEYVFVYHKGQYKGEHVAGQSLDCTERQYAAYLNTVDPTRVMSAYPTAAGRPSIKGPRLPRTPSVGN